MSVYKKLEYLYNYSGSAPANKKRKKKGGEEEEVIQVAYREPRGTLVILDRTFDMISPLIHDY
jgi:hypothetical protein